MNMNEIIKTAGVLVFQDNKVLLVRHGEKAGHLNDTYGIPTGRIENEELSIEAAARELLEESGLKTDIKNLIQVPQVYTATIERKDGVKTFSLETFICNVWEGELETNDEATPEWIDINKLSELNLLPNVEKMVIDALKLK